MTRPQPTKPAKPRSDSQTRVDWAHGRTTDGTRAVDGVVPELLNAIAGFDQDAAAEQLREQALELVSVLQDKQRVLQQREAELNARTALLERDLRQLRLKQQEVKKLSPASQAAQKPTSSASGTQARHVENEPAEPKPSASLESQRRDTEHRAEQLAEREAALHQQVQQLDAQREQLKTREHRLQQRQDNVDRTHDEVTRLHREALELRLATEYVWEEMLEEFPGRRHESAVDDIRRQLADHYRLANDTIARRKEELQALRTELNDQQQRLRQHGRELQLWADRRYDELEARLAKLILRERELDRQENDFQRQMIQWQQQREAYRKEIEALSSRARVQ